MCFMSRLRLWSDKVAQPHRQLKGSLSVDKIPRKRSADRQFYPFITGTTDVSRSAEKLKLMSE